MCEAIQVDEAILKLLKSVEEKDIAIKELSGKIEGYSTVTKFLLERLNHNLVEARIQFASNDFKLFVIKVDKICNRIDMLEQIILYLYNKRICVSAVKLH